MSLDNRTSSAEITRAVAGVSGPVSTSVSTPDSALQHRPTCQLALAREAKRLAAQGLTPRDLAQALRLTEPAIEALLEVAA
jgi:hypothetical protein